MFSQSSCLPRPPHIEIGSKVEIVGELGTYLVMRVDPLRHAADLMLMGRTAKVELGIHVSAIRPITESKSLVRWMILKSA